jgi:hypothetical protein
MYQSIYILFIRFNTKNVSRRNVIRENVTRENDIRGNITRGNEIRGNVTQGNEIRRNVISGKRNSGKRVFGENVLSGKQSARK